MAREKGRSACVMGSCAASLSNLLAGGIDGLTAQTTSRRLAVMAVFGWTDQPQMRSGKALSPQLIPAHALTDPTTILATAGTTVRSRRRRTSAAEQVLSSSFCIFATAVVALDWRPGTTHPAPVTTS